MFVVALLVFLRWYVSGGVCVGDAKFRDGMLFVSKKTIRDTTTVKKRK